MLRNSCIGVSCSAAWIKAVRVEQRGGVFRPTHAHAVPLPVGCIHERSGNIEDSQEVQAALKGIPLLQPNILKACRISVALPHQSSYNASWCIDGLGRLLSPEEIVQRCEAELPGRLESLCIDTHQRLDSHSGTVRVMLVAVRRDVIEGYQRVFSGNRRYVVRMTTDEIGRYNSLLCADQTICNQKIVLLWLEKQRAEIAVWDQGVRIDGCSIGSQRVRPSPNDQSQAGNVVRVSLEDSLREVVVAVEKLLAGEAARAAPIERVVCCGPERGDLVKKQMLQAALTPRIPVTWLEGAGGGSSSRFGERLMPEGSPIMDEFDEALGAGLSELAAHALPIISWSWRSIRSHRRGQVQRWAMESAQRG